MCFNFIRTLFTGSSRGLYIFVALHNLVEMAQNRFLYRSPRRVSKSQASKPKDAFAVHKQPFSLMCSRQNMENAHKTDANKKYAGLIISESSSNHAHALSMFTDQLHQPTVVSSAHLLPVVDHLRHLQHSLFPLIESCPLCPLPFLSLYPLTDPRTPHSQPMLCSFLNPEFCAFDSWG